jgi:hypothetical protein
VFKPTAKTFFVHSPNCKKNEKSNGETRMEQ